ncbi:MAG: outer membrane protein assembly factor BamE [Thiobacillus sp. 63-78]|nr:MAG: outer membrane protein assembly factor BamE [Thiobacillus sp. 63-78]
MRHSLIPALILSLLAGCAMPRIGPYHIDVQQGNALDQENVARLKTGLNRSQVRFLLGTPLVVDPFRTDRWDYVYLYYKAGKLTEQKHITLIFDGDTLARIEGDLPPAAVTEPGAAAMATSTAAPALVAAPVPAASQASAAVPTSTAAPIPAAAPATAEAPTSAAAPATAVALTSAAALTSTASPASAPAGRTESVPSPAAPATATALVASAEAEGSGSPAGSPMPETSIVPPLPSPRDAPAYVDPHPAPELSLKQETNIAQIRPDAMPSFAESRVAVTGDAPVLQSLNAWADAWSRRDDKAYFAAYDSRFVPDGGGSRSAWETRKRQALGAAKNIEVKIESPSVDRTAADTATVTFKQLYRSGSYHDATLKQVRMVEREDRWLIVEEKVLSTLKDDQP